MPRTSTDLLLKNLSNLCWAINAICDEPTVHAQYCYRITIECVSHEENTRDRYRPLITIVSAHPRDLITRVCAKSEQKLRLTDL